MPLEDRTEPATHRRREDARNEGRVAQSNDLNSALVLLTALCVIRAAGPYMNEMLTSIMQNTFSSLHSTELSVNNISPLINEYMVKSILLFGPVILAVASIGITSSVMQVGMKIAGKSVSPDWTRLDPLKGIARFVSAKSLVELLKSVIKVAIVCFVVYSFLKSEFSTLPKLADMSFNASIGCIANLCWRLLMKANMAILILAILDYVYQRFQHEKSLKMTKQEVKEEYKRYEGDPVIKSRIRQKQMEMVRKRSLRDVSTADVIVTNPTHIAVALKYDPHKMEAPIVVAKGQRLLAERIKSIAETSGVPIVENKPVARMLYKTVEVGQPVPDELFKAVAEILAYVYRLNERSKKSRRAYAQ